MEKITNICILIPAYNEEKLLVQVIEGLDIFFENILVVNDGSRDQTKTLLRSLNVDSIHHVMNIGQGGAIGTGLRYIDLKGFDGVITFDADGQHNPEDAYKIALKLLNSDFDIIFGSRFMGKAENIPKLKKILLKIAIFFTNRVFNLSLTDTHNGLKAIKSTAIPKLLFSNYGYSFETEIAAITSACNFNYSEHPITITYTQHSIKNGQKITNAMILMEDMLKMFFAKK